MIFAASTRIPNSSNSTNAIAELRAHALQKIAVLEIGFTQVGGAASDIVGLGRCSSLGTLLSPAQNGNSMVSIVGSTNGAVNTYSVSEQDSETALAQGETVLATEWSTMPGVPTNYMRRWALGSGLGSGAIVSFPRGLGVPASGSVGLFAVANSFSAVECWFVVDE